MSIMSTFSRDSDERARLSRLLIVEDEVAQLRTLTAIMQDEGFEVLGCATASDALQHVEREDFGVAVVDLRLPDLDGTQLLKKIMSLNSKVQVIINTAYGSFDSAKEAVNLGAFAYVEKAGNPDELIRQVHAASRWHLDRYAQDLEQAVSARTRELRHANEGLTREIAERKQAEQERERLAEQLRQSQKMEALGQLAGGVAHDFNNLLTVILGNADVVLSTLEESTDGSGNPIRTGLEQIRSAGTRAASLTRQLLAFSRTELNKPEVLAPASVVGELEPMLRRLIGEHIDLEVKLPPEEYLVKADPGQIEQVAMNLVLNAADAMPKGGHLALEVGRVELDEAYVAGHAEARGGPHVVLSVTDQGEGMSADTMSRIFEPFFTTKPVGKGTGLGLATVYGTVKQLGGHVTVESELGKGSVFRAYWPTVAEERIPAVPTSEADGEPAGGVVLVCEDDSLVREVVCRVLRVAGYLVIEASSGEQAIAAAQAHEGTIDLLISDVVMPEMNGKELADLLRSRHAGLRVLFVSGYAADVIDVDGVSECGAEFLQKPFGPTALLHRVREAMGHPTGNV